MFRRAAVLTGVGILVGTLVMGTTVYGAQNPDDKITIRMLHYWGDNDSDTTSRYLKEILRDEFPKAFPNVELVQDICDNGTYKNKIKILMAADEQPDIMFCYGGGFMQSFVDAGRVLPLDDYLDDFYKEHMKTEMQENFIFDDKQYGVCCTYWTGVLYCNEDLFEQAGAEIPTNYDELVKACDKLRSAEIEPIALGMVDKWHLQQWINDFTIQLGGAKHYKEMAKGTASLDDPALTEAAELTENLIYHQAFYSNAEKVTSGEAEQLFLDGGAAMIYIGSWFTSYAEDRLGDALEVTKMPLISDAQYPNDYHGGGVNGLIVSSETEYPELASEIVAWLAYQLSSCEPETGAFTVEPEDQKQSVGVTGQKILDLYADKKEGGTAWDTLMIPQRTETWLNYCVRLFDGRVAGKRFGEALSRALEGEE